jgi:hypothetical protein
LTEDMPNPKIAVAEGEFREIGHCGGKYWVDVRTDEDGRRRASFGASGFRGKIFGVYALPEGVSVGIIQMGGIGDPWNKPPHPSCYPVFLGSDSQGLFGRQCYQCDGYWRSKGPPSRWHMTCPYCGHHAEAHQFLTQGQAAYVEGFCNMVSDALRANDDGRHYVDMVAIADATIENATLPPFYYVEESQQNQFSCAACGHTNDILGRYGYCSHCGTHDGLREFEADLDDLRSRNALIGYCEANARDAVAAFDGYARHIAKQLSRRVPMTQRRRVEWERKLFHNLKLRAAEFKSVFDIDILQKIRPEDIEFAIRMFHRRHVYEHNGGEVDQKYIDDSGDASVGVKQRLRESADSSLRAIDVIRQLGKNLHQGFHSILPPIAE